MTDNNQNTNIGNEVSESTSLEEETQTIEVPKLDSTSAMDTGLENSGSSQRSQHQGVVESVSAEVVEETSTQEVEETPSEETDVESDDEEALVPLHTLKKVRNEAKNLRERLRVSEAKVAELEAKDVDAELASAVTSLQNELREERLTNALAVNNAGAIEPSAVAKLINLDSIQWENNKPQNLDEVLKATKEAYPKLFSSTKGSGNVGERTSTRKVREGLSSRQLLSEAYKDS